ncbi:MAG: hypothetical protein ACO4CW_12985, partial [Planctomycetota bacterium]
MTRVRRGDIEGDARARLELPALLEEVARHGTSAPGRAALRRAEPAAARAGLLSLLQEPAETIGWGLNDRAFVAQMVPRLGELEQPFCVWMLTLGLHHPFGG